MCRYTPAVTTLRTHVYRFTTRTTGYIARCHTRSRTRYTAYVFARYLRSHYLPRTLPDFLARCLHVTYHCVTVTRLFTLLVGFALYGYRTFVVICYAHVYCIYLRLPVYYVYLHTQFVRSFWNVPRLVTPTLYLPAGLPRTVHTLPRSLHTRTRILAFAVVYHTIYHTLPTFHTL